MRIDIVSDVVCPWCIVGFKQLEAALAATSTVAEIHWQPFELNPQMDEAGENLREHMIKKYRLSEEDAETTTDRLTNLGESLGFPFRFYDEMRIVNTFKAHQLIHWAATHARQHPLKITLFHCYFNRQRDISDNEVLANACVEAGLPYDESIEVLEQEIYADAVRERQRFSIANGIKGVPAMIFNQSDLHTGALGIDSYVEIINQHAE